MLLAMASAVDEVEGDGLLVGQSATDAKPDASSHDRLNPQCAGDLVRNKSIQRNIHQGGDERNYMELPYVPRIRVSESII